MAGGPYVLGLDVGTTTVRCHVYDRDTCSRGFAFERVVLEYPHPSWVEINPDTLWSSVVRVISKAIADAGLSAQDITCLGISTQRNTFTTWHRRTGREFHNLISWQDRRTSDLVEQWNQSYSLKLLHGGSWLLYQLTRQKRFRMASVYRFFTTSIPIRLYWVLNNLPEVASCLSRKEVQFGAVDTWLLWKLTGGKAYCSDYSNASATALFDTFLMDWSGVITALLGIPEHVLPPIVNSGGDLGLTDPNLFGCAIPIKSLLADQQAALFGHCGFRPGDMKCSMGTGSFLTVNMGQDIHASMTGIYPVVGWRTRDEVVYVAEAMAGDAGRCIDWLVTMGFLESVSESETVARSVKDSGGVTFIPAFNGIQVPYNDPRACAGLVGVTLETRPAEVVRAVIEALACHCALLHRCMHTEIPGGTGKRISVDGGVSQNRLLLELLATMINRELVSPCGQSDMASLGAAFMAGLHAGVWNDKEELVELRKTTSILPSYDSFEYDVTEKFNQWERAVGRLLDWYS